MENLIIFCRRFSTLSKFSLKNKLITNNIPMSGRNVHGKQKYILQVMQRNQLIVRFKNTKTEISDFPRIHPTVKNIGWSVSAALITLSFFKYGPVTFLLFIIPLAVFNGRDVHLIIKTFKRDIIFLKRYTKCLLMTKSIRSRDLTIIKLFNKIVDMYPQDIMLQMNDENWTYTEVKCYANKMSRLMQKLNVQKGDAVAIILGNSPEMVAIILGLAQLGIISALVNTNLKHGGLAHCIKVSSCKFIIVDGIFAKDLNEVRPDLNKNIEIFQLKGQLVVPDFKNLEDQLGSEKNDCPEIIYNIHYDDPLLYIYTSGTTGLPKAAVLPHSKFLVNNLGSSILLNLTRDDKIYNPLPLYHTVGLLCGVGPSITLGIPSVIRPMFSASSYFTDCITYNCTLGFYVGEICRYILMVEPRSSDKEHKVTKMFGNGLNAEIWQEFTDRFNVLMTELYGATEGNCNMINIDGHVGAVGFIPLLLPRFIYPFHLIRVDNETFKPIRKSNGMCVLCKPQEQGMLIGMIKKGHIESKYYGYVGEEKSTEPKVVNNVIKKGDSAFLTGDILVKDELLYFYFQDRTGDTYRWKGENVSTLDIETVVSKFTKQSSAVYGVKVKGYETGKPGMLTIEDPQNAVNISDLGSYLVENLPKFAVPRFLRVVDKIEVTGTFKVMKTQLIKEGVHVQDFKNVYYFDIDISNYKPLTAKILQDIELHKTFI